MRSLILLNISLLFLVLQTSGCQNKSVTFITEGPGSVSLVSWDKLESDGIPVGATPVTLEMSKIGDNVVKITSPDKTPQLWVFTEMHGEQFKARLTMATLPDRSTTVRQGAADINESYRLLMKAYQALAAKNYRMAKSISKKLADISPRLAAPLIISGLADLEQGKKEEARLAFTKAKSLDPKDSDIDKLLRAVK